MKKRVVYRHYRICPETGLMYRHRCKRPDEVPAPRGGMTHCAIIQDGKALRAGMSLCSLKDGFCYRTGRELALDRALKGEPFVWPESKAAELLLFSFRKEGEIEEMIERWAVECHDG